ncbi:hypothetical protein WDW37_16550 [Bdellovibrionota bacterium FG-1]
MIPTPLRRCAALLFFCIPLATFEVILITQAHWWHLPYRSIGIWSLAMTLICLPLSVWIARGNPWGFRFAQWFLAAWIILNTGTALRIRNPSLGFFTLLLLGIFGAWIFWARFELRRSFFDPHLKWYQGLPRPLPGVSCQVHWDDHAVDCRVSRLDREGTFVFSSHPQTEQKGIFSTVQAKTRSELILSFRDHTVSCHALAIRALHGHRGIGFQFKDVSSDTQKKLGDFIETLKGEGYDL